jgi:hypothetical protein
MRRPMSFRRLFSAVGILSVLAIAFAWAVPTAKAAPITFAQFQQAATTQPSGFAYLDKPTPNSDAEFVTQYNGVNQAPIPVIFNYLSLFGAVPSDLQGPQAAMLTVTSSTTQPVVTAFHTLGDQQTLGDGTLSDVLTLTRDTPAAEGANTRTNLLTMTFTGQIVGALGGRTPQLSGDTDLDYTVVFTSDFLSFTAGAEQDFSLTFTGWTTLADSNGLEIDLLDNYFQTAFTQGTGTFDSSTLPSVNSPEPAGLATAAVAALFVFAGRSFRRRVRLIPLAA